jgi:predicted transcriptional regulator of viral defense system
MSKTSPPESGRSRLRLVLRSGGDLITVEAAARALGIPRNDAAKLLARWAEQSLLRRVRHGLYAPAPLTSAPDEQVLDDPWTLVPLLFEPGYVGGASAAQHWDLTEQVFRSVFVFTARHVRRTEQTIQGIPFVVTHLAHDKIFGTRALWRGKTKIQISDPARTIIDMLDDPATGGGIRHVSDCVKAYFARADASPETLIEYAERIANGAVFKRLGFLTERLNGPKSLIEACAARLTQGAAKLDPALPSPKSLRQWRLRLPERWKAELRNA